MYSWHPYHKVTAWWFLITWLFRKFNAKPLSNHVHFLDHFSAEELDHLKNVDHPQGETLGHDHYQDGEHNADFDHQVCN